MLVSLEAVACNRARSSALRGDSFDWPACWKKSLIAFGGFDMKLLIIASLCGWSVHTAPMAALGLPVRYPAI